MRKEKYFDEMHCVSVYNNRNFALVYFLTHMCVDNREIEIEILRFHDDIINFASVMEF